MSRRCACCERFSAAGSESSPRGKPMCLSYGCRVLLVEAPELCVEVRVLPSELYRLLEERLRRHGKELGDIRSAVLVQGARCVGRDSFGKAFVARLNDTSPFLRVAHVARDERAGIHENLAHTGEGLTRHCEGEETRLSGDR